MAAEAALAAPARHAVTLPDGRPIYEWSQSLADVDVFLPAPPGAPSSAFDVALSHDRVRLGLKRNPPYIDVSGWWGGAEGEEDVGPRAGKRHSSASRAFFVFLMGGAAGVHTFLSHTRLAPLPSTARPGRPHQDLRILLDCG